MNLVSVLHRVDNIKNRKFCRTLMNASVTPGRSQQKNGVLKCAAHSCTKCYSLFRKSRPNDQSSTNESLDNVTGKNMSEDSGERK